MPTFPLPLMVIKMSVLGADALNKFLKRILPFVPSKWLSILEKVVGEAAVLYTVSMPCDSPADQPWIPPIIMSL